MPVDYDKLIAQFTASTEKANKANEDRYKELLGQFDALAQQVGSAGTFGEAQKLIENIGTAARTEIADQANRAAAQSDQDLISRGLGNTTVRSAQQRGILGDTSKALAAQSEKEAAAKAGLLTQRAGAELSIGGMRASAIEGRQDVGPDLGMFASLLQAAAANEQPATKPTVRTTSSGGMGPGIITQHKAGQAASAAASQAARVAAAGSSGATRPQAQHFPGAASQQTGAIRTPAPAGQSMADILKGATVYTPQGQVTSGGGAAATPAATTQPTAEPTAGGQTPADKITGAPGTEGIVAMAKDMTKTQETYAEYKKRVGKNAVSASYWEAVLKGR